MRKIIDVRCRDCGEVHEEFGRLDDTFRCGSCGGEAKRIISPVKCSLEGTSGDFPGAAIKWARDRTKRGGNS
jgi:Zn finger protein HypA/HybF involved in hydrogenase expression